MISSRPWSVALPQFSPAMIAMIVAAALGGALASGVIAVRYDDGRLTIRLFRQARVALAFALRDTGLLLLLALVLGWAVAAAVERSGWVNGSDGRLVPALAIATVIGWILAAGHASRGGYLLWSIPGVLISLAFLTPSPLTAGGLSIPALQKWFATVLSESSVWLLIGLIALMLVAGLWTSWWTFRRRSGLVALLPTGAILAVEIINDTNAAVTFFAIMWTAAATLLLLRLNFVALKDRWRARHLPRASDTGWAFGEVGVEAIALLLLASFLLLPPLSNADISGFLVPGTLSADQFHPFGLGSSSGHGVVGSIGYSETVRPGSQLKAKSQTVMIVSGDNPTYYPYWRGIALTGWDGIQWYPLPNTPEIPVLETRLAPRQSIPRDDLSRNTPRLQVMHDTIRVLVPLDQTAGAVFSAGEIISVDNQPATVRGIVTSGSQFGGPTINVGGNVSSVFDTVDRIRFTATLHPPYTYAVTEGIPNVDVTSLRNAGTAYPNWSAPYQSLYEGGRIQQGYSTARDTEIAALAETIVHNAGAANPYDQAKAIESWFLQRGRFTYTLTPPAAPVGVRPLDYFLFTSHKGFCQDFSTAMNVMLRTLGIPSRQMSGFGQGVFDEKTRRYLVNSLDAHSWVEVLFPGYGWIPFEPTPDGINVPVARPNTAADLNGPALTPVQPSQRPRPNLSDRPETGTTGRSTGFPNIWGEVLAGVGVLLLLLLVSTAFLVRWLMGVRDIPRIWRRLQFLGDRLRIPRHAGDTPEEFGRRLAQSVPPLDAEVRALASLYTRANFRQGGLNAQEANEARETWDHVRRQYAGLIARAWRDAMRHGDVVSAAGGEASRSRGRRPPP